MKVSQLIFLTIILIQYTNSQILGTFSQFMPCNDFGTNQLVFNAQRIAKSQYHKFAKSQLGQCVAFAHQIVGGINLKMVFKTNLGAYLQIIVYCQPWMNSYTVKSMETLRT